MVLVTAVPRPWLGLQRNETSSSSVLLSSSPSSYRSTYSNSPTSTHRISSRYGRSPNKDSGYNKPVDRFSQVSANPSTNPASTAGRQLRDVFNSSQKIQSLESSLKPVPDFISFPKSGQNPDSENARDYHKPVPDQESIFNMIQNPQNSASGLKLVQDPHYPGFHHNPDLEHLHPESDETLVTKLPYPENKPRIVESSRMKPRVVKTGFSELETNQRENFRVNEGVKETSTSSREKFRRFESSHNQSPSLSILQIQLDGAIKSQGSQAATRNKTKNENQDQQDTSIGLDKAADNPSLALPAADCVKIKPKWEKVRDKHCPITSGLVQEGRGDALRHSIFDEKKYSFKNLKLTKSTTVRVGPEAVKLKEVTSSKAFEDRATHILNEMRKQRRSLQLEYVAKVSVPKKVSGWRDKLNRSDSLKKDEQNLQQYLGKKRNSITKLAGHLKRKLSISKPEGTEEKNSSELEKDETESPRTFARSMNPLDFIMMKEEYIRKNPPPPRKEFVKERSVESESGKQSMESVMNSLKKIVKAINPRREFPSDVKKREDDEYRKREDQRAKVSAQLREEILARARPSTWASACSWENRMQKYRGASITPFNSYATRWNSLQDLRQVEEEKKVVDKKAVRERIQNKVLSLVNQPKERRLEDYFKDCDHRDFSVKGRTKIKPIDYLIPGILPTREIILALEAVEYRRRELTDIIAHFSKEIKTKKKAHTVKPIEHGKGEKGESKYSYGLVTRSNALWETVKPINVAVRMKTEMFSSNLHIPIRAKVSVDSLYVAITTCPGSVGSTQYSEQHKWEHLKGCALFSIVGLSEPVLSIAVQNRLLVVSLPTEEVLAQEQADATFTKCERKPQSQLVKDMITTSSGSLSRISFHTQITFNYFDAVMLVTRFLRTKKNATRYKWKREEVIARLVEGSSSDGRRLSTDEGFLSYGTV